MADSSVNFIVRPWCSTEDYWRVYFDVTQGCKEQLEAAKEDAAEELEARVAEETEQVAAETQAAAVETKACEEIQLEVSIKQRETEADLAKAEPAVDAAMAALETLNRKDLGECKTMTTPPKGVDDIFAAVVVLLAGVEPNVIIQKNGKVRTENRSWDAAKRALLSNIQGFIDTLKTFKAKVDAGLVPDVNWREVRPYLELEHFTPENILTKNRAAAGVCSWVVNIVTYRDIVVTVEPKRQALREATAQLEAANLMVMKAASLFDQGRDCGVEANAGKYLAAEAGFEACQTAMLTLGGMGYAKEYHVERYLREVLIPRTAPVSPHMILNFLAEKVLELPKSY